MAALDFRQIFKFPYQPKIILKPMISLPNLLDPDF